MILLLILLIVLAVIVVPLAVIWALNTLFSLSIAYGLWTWLATLILICIVGSSSATKRK